MITPLANHPTLARRAGPVVLCILDGVGLGGGGEDDAVASARTPNLDRLMATCPSTHLRAHGTAVGMPSDSDLGNSEVGHNAMGAGRVFDQGAKLIDAAIATGAVWRSEAWAALIATPTLHLLGLVSDGNVHSHIDHLFALIRRAAHDGVPRLRVHALTDGRDVAARSALKFIEPLEALLAELSAQGRDYAIASGGGRMVLTMDRYEADWGMVARGWACHVLAQGAVFPSASAAVKDFYSRRPDLDDQYLTPFIVEGSDGAIRDGHGVLLFNFRGDRAIEISRAFTEPELTTFDRGPLPDVVFAGLMEYDGDAHLPERYLVSPPTIDHTVGQFLVAAGRRTFAISETQKFGHVTYFFNGNRSGRLDDELETYVEVPSDVVPFDQRPWMKAAEVSDATVDAILSGKYDHVRLNYPNGDMVGHTGDLEATRIAVEVVDRQLARLEQAVRTAGGVLLITADHGNADEMFLREKGKVLLDPAGAPLGRTAHTTNLVPFIVVDPRGELTLHPVESAGIASVGATILALCGLTPPDDYLPALVQLGERA